MFEIFELASTLVPQISFVTSIATAFMATNSSNKWFNAILSVLKVVSVNVGENKNKDDRD